MSAASATVLVTGARGFIGRHLCRHLASLGYRVLGIGHGAWPESEALADGVARWLNAEVHSTSLRSVCRGATPEVVFHLAGGSSVAAAIANPREDFVRTVAGTMELLEWIRCDAPAVRLVAVSSAAVYGSRHAERIPEDAQLEPISPYGHHKLMMECLCRSHGRCFGLASALARPFSVYGPGLSKQLPWDLCVKLESGTRMVELSGTGAELRDWTHVKDAVRGLERLARLASPEAPTFNVGTGVATPVSSIAGWIAEAFSARLGGETATIHFSGISRAGDPTSLVSDPTVAARAGLRFDWSVRAGLEDFVHWFVEDRRSVR